METGGTQIPKSTTPKYRRAMVGAMIVSLALIVFLVPFQIYFHLTSDIWVGLFIALYLAASLLYLFKVASPRQILWVIVASAVVCAVGYIIGFSVAIHWTTGLSISQIWHGLDDGFRR